MSDYIVRDDMYLKPSGSSFGGSTVKSFATTEEAEAAAKRGEIKKGDRISVGGKSGTWR